MKIKQGFVSNSSTTSFCLVGISEQNSQLVKLYAKAHKDLTEDEIEALTVEEVQDRLEGSSKEVSLYSNYNADYTYFGIDVTDMKDDETKKQFFERAKATVQKELAIDQVYWNIEGWYDG